LPTRSALLITTAPIVGETGWNLDKLLGAEEEAAFYRTVAAGEITVEELTAADWTRVAELTQQYGDHPLGGFDASLIAIAERLGLDTIATLDHRQFRAVRPRHLEAFKLVP
jgi:predicted nucleic acid-binding protein